jgi:hypothetical protein
MLKDTGNGRAADEHGATPIEDKEVIRVHPR